MNTTELYDRGLDDFTSLSELERKVFLLNHFQICCFMDGFTSFFFQGGHSDKVGEVVAFLREIEDVESARAIEDGFRVWSIIESEKEKYADPYDYECTNECTLLEQELESADARFETSRAHRGKMLRKYIETKN